MAKISIKDLNKSYYIGDKEFHVLKDLNLEFKSGELIAIYGESGSGKSTLLNVIGGLDTFENGQINFNDTNIVYYTSKSMDYYRNKKIGFIFQEFNLLENLSLVDNVLLPLNIAGKPNKEAKKRAIELLERVGLKEHIKKKVNQLSGGQKQRVAIARSLANDPDIILADEPTGALDSVTEREILELLQDITRDGKCVAIITHSKHVINYATRVVQLEDGKIIDNSSATNNNIDESASDETDSDLKGLSLGKSLKIGAKNLWSRKFRTFLVSMAISLGITGSLIISSISSEVVENFQQQTSAYEYDKTQVKVWYFSTLADPSTYGQTSDDTEARKALDEWKKEDSRIQDYYISKLILNVEDEVSDTEETSGNFLMTYGVEVDYEDEEYTTMTFGRYPENPYEVYFDGLILGGDEASLSTIPDELKDEFAILYSEENIRNINVAERNDTYNEMAEYFEENIIGQTFTITNDAGTFEYTVVGGKDFTWMGMFQNGYTSFRLPYDINESELEKLEGSNGYSSQFTAILQFEDEETATQFVKDNGNTFVNPKSIGTYLFVIADLNQFAELFVTIFNAIESVFLFLVGISLFVSVFMVAMIVYISTLERKKEIGTLRAIGAKKNNIRTIFISEGVWLGVFGFILSYLFTALGLKILDLALQLGVGVDMVWAGTIFAIVVVVMFIASLYPAITASRQNPIDALREE